MGLRDIIGYVLVAVIVIGILLIFFFGGRVIVKSFEWHTLETDPATHYCVKEYNQELDLTIKDCNEITDDETYEVREIKMGIARKISYRIDGKEYARENVEWIK